MRARGDSAFVIIARCDELYPSAIGGGGGGSSLVPDSGGSIVPGSSSSSSSGGGDPGSGSSGSSSGGSTAPTERDITVTVSGTNGTVVLSVGGSELTFDGDGEQTLTEVSYENHSIAVSAH